MIAPFDMPVAYTRRASTGKARIKSSSRALTNATSSTFSCIAGPQHFPPFQKSDERLPVPFG